MLIITLASLLATSAPLNNLNQESSEVPSSEITQNEVKIVTGKEKIAEIRKNYEKGQYDGFLKEMDLSYQKVKGNGGLEPLAAFRSQPAAGDLWMNKAKNLLQERNKALIAAVEGEKGTFAEQIRSIASQPANEEEADALGQLTLLRHMTPGSGKDSNENALIDLDLEYEYKAIHLDMPIQGGKVDSDAREKQIVLRMEKMEKMRNLSQSFEDSSWKKVVNLSAKSLDDRLAAMYDRIEIDPIVKGEQKSTDVVVQKVVNLLNVHQQKMDELAQSYLEQTETSAT